MSTAQTTPATTEKFSLQEVINSTPAKPKKTKVEEGVSFQPLKGGKRISNENRRKCGLWPA